MKFKLKFVRRYIKIGANIHCDHLVIRNEKRNLLKTSNEDLRLRFLVQFPSVHVSLLVYKSSCPYLYVYMFRSKSLIYFFFLHLSSNLFLRSIETFSFVFIREYHEYRAKKSIIRLHRLYKYIYYSINIYIHIHNSLEFVVSTNGKRRDLFDRTKISFRRFSREIFSTKLIIVTFVLVSAVIMFCDLLCLFTATSRETSSHNCMFFSYIYIYFFLALKNDQKS